jgi:hypothetical protein
MAYILTLLFIAPFIDRKESRWFVSAYAFIFFVTRELHSIFNVVGADGFLVNSYVQMACMCLSVFLLEGKERVISALVFLLFATYNVCVALWWGVIPLFFHPWLVVGVIMLQMTIVTFKERGIVKNTLMICIATIVNFVAIRY